MVILNVTYERIRTELWFFTYTWYITILTFEFKNLNRDKFSTKQRHIEIKRRKEQRTGMVVWSLVEGLCFKPLLFFTPIERNINSDPCLGSRPDWRRSSPTCTCPSRWPGSWTREGLLSFRVCAVCSQGCVVGIPFIPWLQCQHIKKIVDGKG